MNWKKLSSTYLTHYPYFTARKDSCETPAGKLVHEYYVVELRPCVCALAITSDNEVILVKQYRHPIEKVLLEIPGGFVDENEDGKDAVARELLEETGYKFNEIVNVAEVAANPGILNNYTKLFLATGGVKVAEQTLDATEEIEILLMPLEELVTLVMENKLVQSMHINCVFYALIKMGILKLSY